ncbi:hypothetical protein [Natronomonas sp. LN261]|uniref:hypothetical protein n=1 Tax=Natronomonas sp. LN261 TaxID=2750669 RepID=UPI0015EE6902|nr:hypothetical protein [Natronomonas sp. LN261]
MPEDGTERRSPASTRSLAESLKLTAEAEEKHDTCPECGEEYVGTDTTLAGDVLFIHQEDPLDYCELQPDTERSEGADRGDSIETDGGQEIPRLEAAEGEICTGAIVVDLSSGKALQVVGKSAKTVGEHRQTRSDATAEMFGAEPDEPVYQCVFLPDGEKLTPPTKTYAYPESRLLRYPVENATEHAGGIQMWLRSAFIDELAEGVADDTSFSFQFEAELRELLTDVYSSDLAATFEELVAVKRGESE